MREVETMSKGSVEKFGPGEYRRQEPEENVRSDEDSVAVVFEMRESRAFELS